MNFQRNYLLSLGSIDVLKENIIKKDFRNLTSGGLNQIIKYYIKIFDIDIKQLGVDFKEIEEIHTRRHIYVHRNGLVDDEYCTKYPEKNARIDSYIYSDNQYIIDAFNKILNFGGLINKQLLNKFPDVDRSVKYQKGKRDILITELTIMVEIIIKNESF